MTKVCYYLEFSYIYKQLIINKKSLCLIAEGCTSGVHITNCLSVIYAVLFSMPQMMSRIVTVCHTVYHGVTQCPQIRPVGVNLNQEMTLDVTYVQIGVQLVTKVCYYLGISYIYKQLIINKKALCLIAEGCTFGVHITNCLSATYAVLLSYYMVFVNIPSNGKMMSLVLRLYSQLLEHPSQL